MKLFKSPTRKRAESERAVLASELLKIQEEKGKINLVLQPREYFNLVVRAGGLGHDIDLLDKILNYE
jgi:hypothetical protein